MNALMTLITATQVKVIERKRNIIDGGTNHHKKCWTDGRKSDSFFRNQTCNLKKLSGPDPIKK